MTKAGADPQKLRDVRGALAPVLRDTLGRAELRALRATGRAGIVHESGLCAQPRFLRHYRPSENVAQCRLKCWAAAGRRMPADAWWARLIGLPYALAEAEQNFLIPTREQALIWGDLVPQDDPERRGAALVGRDAVAASTGSA